MALKKARLVKRVVGYKSPSTTESTLDGRDRCGNSSALLAVSGADIVLVAVPVAA